MFQDTFSHSPNTRERGKLKMLLNLLIIVLYHIYKMFGRLPSTTRLKLLGESINWNNNFTKCAVEQVIKNVHNNQTNRHTTTSLTMEVLSTSKFSFVCLPFKAKQDESNIRSLKNTLEKVFTWKYWAKICLQENKTFIKVSN